MTSELQLILAALALFLISGLPGLLSRNTTGGRRRFQRVATLLMVLGGLTGWGGLALFALRGGESLFELAWSLPGSRVALRLDLLSAFFLAPVFLVPPLAAVYGLEYRPADSHATGSRRLDFSLGLLAASMGLVLLARDGLFFLVVWEVMALSAWLAATIDEQDPSVRKAGWVYLVATHAGTLCLIALFALWQRMTGSLLLDAPAALPAAGASTLFLLALLGFGLKAGLMPLHVWLPGLHAGAPSQVSAVLSGVMLKVGVYGLVRFSGLLPDLDAAWGPALLILGAGSAVAGIARALTERHLKRLLACSSMENIGVIVMGLGLALLGRAHGRPEWILLGLGGALLHVWNHALFKTLLFLGAGAVIQAAGTGVLDRLGGLGRRMPRVTVLFILGALGACALPPLNGFVSEWLIYLGLFNVLFDVAPPAPGLAALAGAAAALALAGALTLAAFMKVLGTGLLGEPRAGEAPLAQDSGGLMLLPMGLVALLMLTLGLAPLMVAPVLEAARGCWMNQAVQAGPTLTQLAPLEWISLGGLGLLAASGMLLLLLRRGTRVPGWTWDCGYAAPTTRMQTSPDSLGRTVTGMLAPELHFAPAPVRPAGLFPGRTRQPGGIRDLLLDRFLRPGLNKLAVVFKGMRVLQGGLTQHYILYILAALLLLLLFLSGTGN